MKEHKNKEVNDTDKQINIFDIMPGYPKKNNFVAHAIKLAKKFGYKVIIK